MGSRPRRQSSKAKCRSSKMYAGVVYYGFNSFNLAERFLLTQSKASGFQGSRGLTLLLFYAYLRHAKNSNSTNKSPWVASLIVSQS